MICLDGLRPRGRMLMPLSLPPRARADPPTAPSTCPSPPYCRRQLKHLQPDAGITSDSVRPETALD